MIGIPGYPLPCTHVLESPVHVGRDHCGGIGYYISLLALPGFSVLHFRFFVCFANLCGLALDKVASAAPTYWSCHCGREWYLGGRGPDQLLTKRVTEAANASTKKLVKA